MLKVPTYLLWSVVPISVQFSKLCTAVWTCPLWVPPSNEFATDSVAYAWVLFSVALISWLGFYPHMHNLAKCPGIHEQLYRLLFLFFPEPCHPSVISLVLLGSPSLPFSVLCPENWGFTYLSLLPTSISIQHSGLEVQRKIKDGALNAGMVVIQFLT